MHRDGETVYAITNNHVAGNSDEILVITNEGEQYSATLIGTDTRKDLAVISFIPDEADILPVVRFGDSDALYVGDWVVAVGNPFGFSSTVTAGIVSAKERIGPPDNISDFIQTDAAINRGNSGGPLVNLLGEVVGINTWITTTTGVNMGLGFAIPSNNIRKAVLDIVEKGVVEYGWLGVEIDDVNSMYASQLNFPGKQGAIITQIFRDSPAERGGILPGDIVTTLNGTEIRNYLHLVRTVGDVSPGNEATLTVFRNGEYFVRSVMMGDRKDNSSIFRSYRFMWPGMVVIPITDDLRSRLDLPRSVEGLIVQELTELAAPQAAGIRPGDIIVAIGDRAVKNLLDFYDIVNDTENRELELKIERSGEPITLKILRG